jgi:uncharacterized protein
MKFIVDNNAGKLVKWLRMMGYDTAFFNGTDDWQMVMIALKEDRVILTRDTQILKRGVIASGRVKALFIQSDNQEEQVRQVVETFHLDTESGLFTICLEDNGPLEVKTKAQVEGRVPPYVFSTQEKYMECPVCHRIYWKGTHWQAMMKKMGRVSDGGNPKF